MARGLADAPWPSAPEVRESPGPSIGLRLAGLQEMAWFHLTARMRSPFRLFSDWKFARAAFDTYRDAFPDAMICNLMPNHPHLLVPGEAVALGEKHQKVRRSLARRAARGPGFWESSPAPQEVPQNQLARVFRYIALNQARAELNDDPLIEVFSTYRDLFGAVAKPWTNPGWVFKHMPRSLRSLPKLHAYVSADSATTVPGSAAPSVDTALADRRPSWEELSRAVVAATRCDPAKLSRRGPLRQLLIAAATRLDFASASRVGGRLGITRQAAASAVRAADPVFVSAVMACLSDERLIRNITSSGLAPQKTPVSFQNDNLAAPSQAWAA